MRFERRGQIEPLFPRMECFIREALGGISLDTPEQSSIKRPDWECLRGLVVIEIKTLVEDGSKRMNNLVAELEKREDWPSSYGEVPFSKIIQNLDDADAINKKALDRAGRAIKNHFGTASRQLKNFSTLSTRNRLVRIVLLVNENHEIYHPDIVSHIVGRRLRKQVGNSVELSDIDLVLYIGERHAAKVGNEISFPIMILEGADCVAHPWKNLTAKYIAARYINWCNGRKVDIPDDGLESFQVIADIPDEMPTHEYWRLCYRRNPYFQNYAVDQLRDKFDDISVAQEFFENKDSPLKITKKDNELGWEIFTHLLEEINSRGIPMENFPKEKERWVNSARRMKFPIFAVQWIGNLFALKP